LAHLKISARITFENLSWFGKGEKCFLVPWKVQVTPLFYALEKVVLSFRSMVYLYGK
jgi:hypothetical protein